MGDWKGKARILGECRNSGLAPSTLLSTRARAEAVNLMLDYREGLGNAGAAPSLDKDFTAFYVPGMCAHKAKDPPDLQTSCSAASWTLLLSLTLGELADNQAIKIIRKLIWA